MTYPTSPGGFCERVVTGLKSALLDHPRSVGESYFEHQRTAFGFARSLLLAAFAAAVHAIIPCLCKTTARQRIADLHARLQGRVPVQSAGDNQRSSTAI